MTSRSAVGLVPPWALAAASMLSVQLGSALSVGLVRTIGPAGTAWLRLTMGAMIFLLLARPPLRSIRRPDVPFVLGLGVATGLMSIAFLAAINRIPLGTAVAIEFLGPLTVAATRRSSRRALLWPALALLGVVLLTEPWKGQPDLVGIGFAGLAAIGWGSYILLTQRIGDRFTGIRGLSLTVPIAALTAAAVGIPQAAGHLTFNAVIAAAGLAFLMPALPLAFEMLALRRMTPTAFGTLMAVEPAIAIILGLMILHQHPTPDQILGILLVVTAGAAAQQGGRRQLNAAGEPTGPVLSAGDRLMPETNRRDGPATE